MTRQVSEYFKLVVALRTYLRNNGVPESDIDNVVDGVLDDLTEAIEELGER